MRARLALVVVLVALPVTLAAGLVADTVSAATPTRVALPLRVDATAARPVTAAVAKAAARAAAVAHGRRTAVIRFRKNYKNTFRSKLTWTVYATYHGTRTTLVSRHWRAGSGSTKHATNSCIHNHGWLPSGRYRPELFSDYHGHIIKGRAIYLGNKRCKNGTLRTDLFIHTEQGAKSRQCPNRKGDQACRWEYPQINDYRSLGCIKLSPAHLHQLYDAWRRFFKLGYSSSVQVHVH